MSVAVPCMTYWQVNYLRTIANRGLCIWRLGGFRSQNYSMLYNEQHSWVCYSHRYNQNVFCFNHYYHKKVIWTKDFIFCVTVNPEICTQIKLFINKIGSKYKSNLMKISLFFLIFENVSKFKKKDFKRANTFVKSHFVTIVKLCNNRHSL